MGEIKSTLDLVMEKTRHLTLSQEEKKAQKEIEVNKRLQGLLQKYQDNLLKKENLKKELDHLKIEYDLDVNKMLAKLLLNSLKIDQNLARVNMSGRVRESQANFPKVKVIHIDRQNGIGWRRSIHVQRSPLPREGKAELHCLEFGSSRNH